MAPPDSEPGELERRLSEIENQLGQEIQVEQSKVQEIDESTDRIERLIKELENHLRNNENIEHERKIEESLNDLRGDLNSLNNKISEVNESWHQVESAQAEIRSIRDAMASVVEGEIDNKIVEEFQNRRDALSSSLRWWKIWTGLSILVLFMISAFIYQDINNQSAQTTVILSKSLLILPAFVTVYFSFHQYSNHKRLIEQYEFKTSMADSLMGFREILKQDFSEEEQDRVGEFVIDSVNRMYSDPENSLNTDNTGNDVGQQGVPRSNTDLVSQIFR